jgi:hypothetical protein
MKIIHFHWKLYQIVHNISKVSIYIVFVNMLNIMVKKDKNQFVFILSFVLASTFPHDIYLAAKQELLDDANTHYHTNIGWATYFEIIATVLVLIATALTFYIGANSRSEKA